MTAAGAQAQDQDPSVQPAGELLLRTAGLNVRLRASAATAPLLTLLADLWADSLCSITGEPDIDGYVLAQSDQVRLPELAARGRGADPELLVITVSDPESLSASYAVSGQLTQRIIKTLIGSHLLLHAAAIDVDGFGPVLVTGASGAGKTTATVHLGQHGTYLTDELTILEPDSFAITAFPKPLSLIDSQSGTVRLKADVRPADVGITRVGSPTAGPSAAPAVFLLANRKVEADGVSFEPVDLLDALAVVAGQSSSIWQLPDPLGSLARLLDSVGGLRRVTYPEASGLLDALRAHPAPVADSSGEWETISPRENPAALITDADQRMGADAEQAQSAAVALSAQLRLWPFHQALWGPDGVAVLTEHPAPHVVVMRGAGAIAWDCLLSAAPMSFGELVEVVQQRIGHNPEAAAVLSSTVRALAAERVIAID